RALRSPQSLRQRSQWRMPPGRSGSRRNSPRVLPHMSWEMSVTRAQRVLRAIARTDAQRPPARTEKAVLGVACGSRRIAMGARFTKLRGALRSFPNCTTTHVDGEHEALPGGVSHGIGELDGILTPPWTIREDEDAGPGTRYDGREAGGAQSGDERVRLGHGLSAIVLVQPIGRRVEKQLGA